MKYLICLGVFAGSVLFSHVSRAADLSCLSVSDAAGDVKVVTATSTKAVHPDRVDLRDVSLHQEADHWTAVVTTVEPFHRNAGERANVVLLFDRNRFAGDNDWHASDTRIGADAFWSITNRFATSSELFVSAVHFDALSGKWKNASSSSTASQKGSTLMVSIPLKELPSGIERWRVFAAIGGTGWKASDEAPARSTSTADCGFTDFLAPLSTTTRMSVETSHPQSQPDDSLPGMLVVMIFAGIWIRAVWERSTNSYGA